MKRSVRILTGTVFAILIVAAGLAAGLFLSSANKTEKEEQAAAASYAAAPVLEPALPPNPNIYDVSPPNRATLPETKNLEITPTDNFTFVMLPDSESGSIKEEQLVLLYDRQGRLIETFGKVYKVQEGAGPIEGNRLVYIALGIDGLADAGNAARAKIITGHRPDSARLPTGALIRDDQEEPHVWEAEIAKDGTATARLTKINMVSATYDFFVLEQTSHTGGFYILNPDKSLKDGQTISIRQVLYTGPLQTDESRVSESVKARQIRRASLAARTAADNDYAGPMSGDDNSCGGAPAGTSPRTGDDACGPSPGALDKFMRNIKNLTPPEQPAAPGTLP